MQNVQTHKRKHVSKPHYNIDIDINYIITSSFENWSKKIIKFHFFVTRYI